MSNLNNSKLKDLDDIFYATKDSQGHENAIASIKYVLFNDDTVLDNVDAETNKYLYISNTNNARKKAMLIQEDDLTHIIIKYCLCSFGLRGKNFNVNEEELILTLKRLDRLEISSYEAIELIAFAATGEIENAINILYANEELYRSIVDYMLNERYSIDLASQLDNFSGIIDNNDMKTDERFSFYDTYSNIDEVFAEIKRNNPEYIK